MDNSRNTNINTSPGSGGQTRQYTHVQLIAYHLFTLQPFATGFEDTLYYDIWYRFYTLYQVMQFCREQLERDQPTILKIFVAPEFYGRAFKGQDIGAGHYLPTDVWKAANAFQDRCAKSGLFDDWLVIPGTFVMAEKAKQTEVAAQPEEMKEAYRIFNALYAFTGDGTQSRFIRKKTFSFIDILGMDLRGKRKDLPFTIPKTAQKQSSPIQVRNVSIGIDICLDYTNKRLRSYLESIRKPSAGSLSSNPPWVDVQVIPACGIAIAENNGVGLAIKQGGHIFRVDGHPDEPYYQENGQPRWSQCAYMKAFGPGRTFSEANLVSIQGKGDLVPQNLQIRRDARMTDDLPNVIYASTWDDPRSYYAIFPPCPIIEPVQ